MRWPALTTPPAPRPRSSRPPLFTTKFFSTKSFGPGHLVGALVLVGGTYAIAKGLVGHAHATRALPRGRVSAALPGGATLAQVESARGPYGRKP